MTRQLSLDYCEKHNEPMEYLRESYPEEFPRRRIMRHPDKREFTRCSSCRAIVPEDETDGGLCLECARQHHAEITDDSVG